MDDQRAFATLARMRLRGEAGERAKAKGRALQDSTKTVLRLMPDTLHKDRNLFFAALNAAMKNAEIKLRAPIKRAILAALSEYDETAAICRSRRRLDGAREVWEIVGICTRLVTISTPDT